MLESFVHNRTVGRLALLLVLVLFVFAACTSQSGTNSNLASLVAPQGNLPIESVLNYEVAFPSPTPPATESLPTPTPEAGKQKQYAVIITSNARANIRDNASTGGTIIGKGNPGDAFEVLGNTSDGEWYQVCCVAGTDKSGWVAASVVRITDNPTGPVNTAVKSSDTQSTTATLLNSDLTVKWSVNWQCGSERCTVKQCSGTVDAAVKRPNATQWLPIEHNVTWDKTCFSTDNWVFDVDRLTGKERTGEYENNFLYSYWLGAAPGDASGVFPMKDDSGVLVHCSDPQKVEISEGGGWTSVYDGTTCHDLRTGMLVYMRYTKRWLFSGDFDGQKYDRAFFGDTETLEQKLEDTNVSLSFVHKVK
ncbi:MAG: SH3 domain-containing protein [Caldilineaceae bacterium]